MFAMNNSHQTASTHHALYPAEVSNHIYNEMQYPEIQNEQLPSESENGTTIPIPANSNYSSHVTGIIYGFRTRHLSCIEENDSDSLHSTSYPSPYEMMKDVDETFKKLVNGNGNGIEPNQNHNTNALNANANNNVDNIEMIDETRLYCLDYLSDFNDMQTEAQQSEEEELELEVSENCEQLNSGEYWQSTQMESIIKYPDIMTTSCYGALNDSFGSENSTSCMQTSTPKKHPQQQQQIAITNEPIYATPDKNREFNRSFDSATQSQSSSMNGYYEQTPSMTTSLDLKCMSTSMLESRNLQRENFAPMELSFMSTDETKTDWKAQGSRAEDELEEMAAKCLDSVENDLKSIRRLLDHEASTCPSCHIAFDKSKRRKLIDTCGHERCYSCMFRNDQCPMCMNASLKDVDCNNAQGYDTGIGGSTSTIVSPLGSPQPQLRSQSQRTNSAALAKFMQLSNQCQEPISSEYHQASAHHQLQNHQHQHHYQQLNNYQRQFAKAGNKLPKAFGTHTVTADVHSTFNGNRNGTSNGSSNYSEINAAAFATPPTRRRFFGHKNFRSALTGSNGGAGCGHRRTASNDGCNIETASILSGGSDLFNGNTCASSLTAEKQNDQLRARLGLLLDTDHQPGNATNTTTSSSSSQNISPEQTLSNGNPCLTNGLPTVDIFGSQLSVAKDDTLSLSGRLKACSLLDQNPNTNEPFPVKVRKSAARRSARSGQSAVVGVASKRSAIYQKPMPVQSAPAAQQLQLKPLFFEVPLQEPDPPFIGRQWLLRELSNILTATATPGVLISGNPGSGKTALILQLVEYSCFGRRNESAAGIETTTDGIYSQINIVHDRIRALASHIVGYHFCQADSNLTCLVADFVHSLAAQLCQAPQLIAYREYLLNEPHLQDILSVKECIADAERVMRMAILEPLTILKRSGKIPAKTCVILIDALCEAEYHRPDHGHTIASFLAKMTQFFPSWLKVVATVRTQMLEFVKGLSYTKQSLDSWASNDFLQKDMLDYITFRINHSAEIQHNIAGAVKDSSGAQLKFIGHMQSLSKGSMLYAKLILDLIERGQLVIKSTSYNVLPVSLAQIFLLHFNLRFPTTSSFEKIAPILEICLATLYPLTISEIYYTICALKTDEIMSWDDFLQRFKLLDGFLIKRIDNTYMFFHSSFREWLMRRDEGESTKFLCDFRQGHAAIAFRLSRLQAPLDAEQTLELGHHMLKAHIYRNCQAPQPPPRDLQSFWVASVADNISAALGSLRNVYSPNVKVSRLILLAGASPNYRTEFMGDATILCIAAHEGIVPMVSLLLEFGADVELTNSQGCTPLILAAMYGHCDVVRLLVAAGSSLGQTDTTQRCALVHAARTGRLNVVKYLLACDWTPRPQTNDVCLSEALQQAVVAAAAQDHVTILEDLLEMDIIDINSVDACTGDLALTAAAKNGCVDTVAVLISRGAQIDARNKNDFTALSLAVKEGHWAVVEKLLQNGADCDVPVTAAKKTPLMIAAEEGHTQLLEMLITHGALLESQDHEGLTAFSWACLRGRQPAVQCLLEHGCNKDHTDNNGRTALDLAAYQGAAALIQYLIEQGANLEHIDVNGMRPLDRSIACRNIKAVQVFLKRGAKLGPTTWSMAMGKPEIMIVLLNKLLEDGNILYRKNRFQEAAHRYQYALRKIANLDALLERSAIFTQLRTNMLLNLSRCKRKLNELDESIDLATQAIQQKPSSYEGYYARAKAHMEKNNLHEALTDTNEAMQQAVQSGTEVLPEVLQVLKRIQTELLNRITAQDVRLNQGASTSKAALAASSAAMAATVNESHYELTDL